jgi:predicted nucleic acid-binding Zn ribbon protein
MKCDVCGKEIPKGQEFHPAYIKGFQRIDGIACSTKCAIEFLDRGKS